MRNLAATADLPGPGRRDASGAVNDAFKAWWLPDALGFSPDYDKFFLQNEDTMGLQRLLESLASGGTKALPAQVVRTEAGLELTDSKGEKVLVAVPAPP